MAVVHDRKQRFQFGLDEVLVDSAVLHRDFLVRFQRLDHVEEVLPELGRPGILLLLLVVQGLPTRQDFLLLQIPREIPVLDLLLVRVLRHLGNLTGRCTASLSFLLRVW